MSVWFEDFSMWIIQPLEIADEHGNQTGRWRMTATSDEDGGGPFGDTSHDHATAEEAKTCAECDKFCSQVAGFPSREQMAQMLTTKESATLDAALVLLRRGETAQELTASSEAAKTDGGVGVIVVDGRSCYVQE